MFIRTVLVTTAVLFSGVLVQRCKATDTVPPRGLVLDVKVLTAALHDERAAAVIRASAEKILSKPIVPVTVKKAVPPSGDKRDYMSLAPYFWPNPNTPDGLPYIRKDGEHNPAALIDSDRPRLNAFREDVVQLASAYYVTSDERFAADAVKRIRIFLLDEQTGLRPNLHYAQAVRGSSDGRSTGTIETASLPEILDAAELLAGSSAWSEDVDIRFHRWCDTYSHWLETSSFGRSAQRAPNNIGTYCDLQRIAFALYLGRTEEARRMLEKVKQRIDLQVQSDGKQPHELTRTNSLGYSVGNLRGLMLLARLGERAGVDLWQYESPTGGGIRKALEFLALYRDDSVPWPYRQIDARPHAGLDRLLRTATEAYREPRYAELADKFGPAK